MPDCLSRPWSFGFTIRFDGSAPGVADDTYIYLLIDDELGAQNALEVEINGGTGGANHVMIILLDDLDNNFEVGQALCLWRGAHCEHHLGWHDPSGVLGWRAGCLGASAQSFGDQLHRTGVNIGDFIAGMHWTMENFQFQGKIPA